MGFRQTSIILHVFLRKTKVSCYKVLEERQILWKDDVSNVFDLKISILLNKILRKTKYHVTNVYEKKVSCYKVFRKIKISCYKGMEEKQQFQEEFYTNFYEIMMKTTFATER